jgi:hypothetical protein
MLQFVVCHSAVFNFSEYYSTEYYSPRCHFDVYQNAEWHSALSDSAECHSTEYYSPECHFDVY